MAGPASWRIWSNESSRRQLDDVGERAIPSEQGQTLAIGPSRPLVLLTGAAGQIGTAFRLAAGERYRFRLADRVVAGLAATPGLGHEVVALDVADAAAVSAAVRGSDAVVHLAADPSPAAAFVGSLLPNNIVGTYNVAVAASAAGCRRLVFASSVQTVLGYPPGAVVTLQMPVWPTNAYGASKCWGEAIVATVAGAGLSCVSVRIGAYDAPWLRQSPDPAALAAYVSARDLNQLLVRCLDADLTGHAIVWGVSANCPNRVDLAPTKALLGYEPQDDGFALPPG